MRNKWAEPAPPTERSCRGPNCQRHVPAAGPPRWVACEKSRASARRQDAAVGAILISLTSLNSALEFAARHRRWALGLALVPTVILAARRAKKSP